MKLINTSVIFILAIFLLAGCGPIYKKQYAYVPPSANMGKMCIAQCIQSKNTCEQMCYMQNENCHARERQESYYRYELYKHDRERHGQEINKDLNHFDHSYTCNHSCNCLPSYNACYSACGGDVLEHKVCVAFCGKK